MASRRSGSSNGARPQMVRTAHKRNGQKDHKKWPIVPYTGPLPRPTLKPPRHPGAGSLPDEAGSPPRRHRAEKRRSFSW